MTNLKELSKAESTREKLFALRQKLSTRSGKPPEVENLLPALPGDNIKKLQAARQGTDCNVTIIDMVVPPGSVPGETFIALHKDGIRVSEWEEVPIPPDPSYPMVLPGKHTDTPGPFRLTYEVDYGGVPNVSDVFKFFIDTVAPNHGAPGGEAIPPDEIKDGLLTREILDTLGDFKMIIPTPDDVKQGDIYTAYYGKSDPGIPVDTFTVDEDSTAPIEFELKKTTIEAWGEGSFVFYCKYEDRVGNVGPSSKPFKFDVRLTRAPSALQPPEVPANDDGVVDLKEAFPNVAVIIPPFTDGLPGDVARVTFDGILQADKPTDGTAEVIVDVPYKDVAANGDGPRPADVTYAIVRNSVLYPEPTGLNINIDLSIPGPTNPEPDPDKGNPNLIALVVKGSTGDDTLVESDVGKEIEVDLTIPDPTTLKVGDILKLKWEDTIVPPPQGQYIVDGTEPAGFKIPFKLPSSVFEATRNGKKTARYVISNPANGTNENPSLPTVVDVYIIPVTLPEPVIQNLYTNPAGRTFLNCDSLRDIPVVGKAAIVRIAGGGSLVPDLKLNFKWVGSSIAPGAPDVEDYLFEKTLQGNEHVSGFEVYLPFNAALRPIKDGNGTITYDAELDGRPHTSDPHAVRVVVANNEGVYCPGTQEE
ncbi:hypothetical protein AB4P93_01095 [Pseudomonas sp. B26140]|uniref:hypothetical protein n=1 Tax=Pseudomonas sp. B26140 TaxID=3235112 RepID=UPI0037834370